MTRREVLARFGATAAVYAAPMLNFGRCRLNGAEVLEYSTRTLDVVGRSLVVDMLGLLTLDYGKLARWHKNPDNFTVADFARLRDSGITVFHPAVDLNQSQAHSRTVQWLTDWNRLIAARPEWLMRVHRPDDFASAKRLGKIGVMLGMQNSDHFRTEADVDVFYSLGQRISQLTYNETNRLGSGCGAAEDHGLTDFGFRIVEQMNRAGMMIDVSHAGEQTSLDAFAASSKPVLITHSNCKALVRHRRCKSDDIIKAMAKTGGVMGITGLRAFTSTRPDATIHDALDHFDHVAKLVGVEFIGLGSDTSIEARSLDVSGLNHARRVFDLTEGLLRRGYTPAHLESILGRNFERVTVAHRS